MSAMFRSSRSFERASMTRPHWQQPSRREHIHGPIQPMDAQRKSLWARIRELIA